MAEEKKSVIIVSHAMEIGGAERALLGMLEAFDYEKYRVDLFLMRHEGELFAYLPEQVNLLPEIRQYTGLAVPFSSILKRGMFRVAAGRLTAKIKAHSFVKRHGLNPDNGVKLEYSHKYTLQAMPMISEKEYDLAISFLTPHYFAAKRVKAKKKAAWIHTDYSYVETDIASELKMWSAYDYIVSISDACREGFLSRFPELAGKIVDMQNIIHPDLIKRQAEEADVSTEMPDEEGIIRLLSVGRFSAPKNFDSIPEICRRILEGGVRIRWYLVGYGGDEALIRRKIRENGVEEQVIILGKRSNPYPYMKACDVYVQPSRYEGKCVSVREAQILGKPVIITDYPTAVSQLKDGYDGVVVPLETARCAEEMKRILQDKKLLESLRIHCQSTDYTNHEEVRKLYRLIG